MAAPNRKAPAQHWIVRILPLETLKDALNLARRYQEGKAFRLYVLGRIWLIVPVCVLMLVIGISCAVATLIYLADMSSWLALPALLLLPLVLIGSLFVQAYVFFYWLENRALARALGHRAKKPQGPVARWLATKVGADMGTSPPVPWILAALFLIAPLAMLGSFAPGFTLLLVAAAILAPILYARFDR
jgi:hypothetical protein